MFCIDDNPLFGFLDQYKLLLLLLLLKKLKTGKRTGPDLISNEIIKYSK
jgi:hypothetical protein